MLKLTPSPETTYLTEPQLPDGRIDYLAAINKQLAAQVPPEKNLIVGIWSLTAGEQEMSIVCNQQYLADEDKSLYERTYEYRERFCKALGLDAPPSFDSFVKIVPNFFSESVKDYEKELLEFHSKDELALMIEKYRERERVYHCCCRIALAFL